MSDRAIPSFQGTASPGNRAAHGRGEETVGTNPGGR
jgi:hypothetical protein